MKYRFNPDSGIVTIVQDEDSYNAQKRATAHWLIGLKGPDLDHDGDRCVICEARVDLSDIETFELSEDGLICYFCTVSPDDRMDITSVAIHEDRYFCLECKIAVGGGDVVWSGPVAQCPDCCGLLERLVCLSSSTNLNSS